MRLASAADTLRLWDTGTGMERGAGLVFGGGEQDTAVCGNPGQQGG